MAAKLSIIIPVYNEARAIGPFINQLKCLTFPWPVDIIISDGHPEQTTLRALDSSETQGLIPLASEKGRGPQLNAGARAAQGEVLLFLHVDTRLDQTGADLLAAAVDRADPSVFCGAFDLAIDSPRPIFRFIEKIASRRSRLTRLPYGDQALFISRSLFRAVDGFPAVPIMEDVGLMQRIKQRGIQPVFLSATVSTSARRWEKEGILFTTLRNLALITLYLFGAPPERLVRYYRS